MRYRLTTCDDLLMRALPDSQSPGIDRLEAADRFAGAADAPAVVLVWARDVSVCRRIARTPVNSFVLPSERPANAIPAPRS